MATQNSTVATKSVQRAAAQLAAIDFEFDLLNQDMAMHVSPLLEAVINMLMIVYYQIETGHAKKYDFLTAKADLRQSLKYYQDSTELPLQPYFRAV